MSRDTLTSRLLVRASKAQLGAWALAAELEGVPLSEWVRSRLDDVIAKLLGEG